MFLLKPNKIIPLRPFGARYGMTSILIITLFSACSFLPKDLGSFMKSQSPTGADTYQVAYKNFTVASIAISQGRLEDARKFLSAATENDPESPYLCKKMALLLKELKDYKSASVYALRCLSLIPDDINIHILLGDIYALKGDDSLALEQYREVLKFDPENERIRLLIITILIREDQLTEALVHLDKLNEQSYELVLVHYYRGRIYLGKGYWRKAEEAFLKALRLDDCFEPALYDLATLYHKVARDKEAIEIYEKLLELYPENISVRERLTNLYYKLGLVGKAEQQTKTIKERLKPGDPGRQTLGLIYLRQGKLNESIEELKMIVSAWPDDHKSRYYLAAAYSERGDIEKSFQHFKRIKPESKYFINAQVQIALQLGKLEKYQEAIVVLEKAISFDKERLDLYLILASIYETMKNYETAIAIIREGLKYEKDNIELLWKLGILFDKNGDKDACIEQMMKILQIDSNHAESLNYIGYTYAEQGIKLDEAMDFIQNAIRLKPNSGYIVDSLGWVYFQKGLYDKAVHYLERAAELTPDDPTINEHLGDAYLKKKGYKKSLEYYKKALTLDPSNEQKLKDKIIDVEKILEQHK